MNIKELKFVINISLIFVSVLLIYGIFSPWITVATIFSVSGTSSIYGLFIFISAFMFIVYGLSGFIKNSVLNEYQNLIRKVTLLFSTFTLLNLMYLIYRYLDAIKEFNKITNEATASTENLGELGQSLDNLFQNITNAIKPTIGLGFYIILIGLVVGLILSIPVISEMKITLDNFAKYFSFLVLVLFTAFSIFIYNSSKTSKVLEEISEPNTVTNAPTSLPSLGAATDINNSNINAPEVNNVVVKKKLLTLVWNPVFNNRNEIINRYQYRFKTTFSEWSEPIDCEYLLTDIANLKSTDTLSCDMDWSEVPESNINSLTKSESQGLDFVIRAIDNEIMSDWSFKPYVLYLYEHPEFLGN